MEPTPYTNEFYQGHHDVSLRSARAIVPLALGLVQPRSVVDVGCGTGTWLSVFQECGVDDVYGVDGEWVNRKALVIPEDRFLAVDLRRPFQLGRRFDLAVSLEVGEHLPGECARAFVASLTRLAPAVLFSAAIPFQGGADHVNEQWPDYWAERFADEGYAAVDCMRRKVWRDENVEWYYAQNTLMFASRDVLDRSPALQRECERTATGQLSVVHPRKYLEAIADMRKLLLMAQDLASVIPSGDTFILVDEDSVRRELTLWRAIPFLERDGRYWGPPLDDITAIREVERLRRSGARFIVFAWPAFWWLGHYAGFHRHLRAEFRCRLENERLVVFDLESTDTPPSSPAAPGRGRRAI